jgi:hypothetical protein
VIVVARQCDGPDVGAKVDVEEYDPVWITVRTGRDVTAKPVASLDGISVGEPAVMVEGDSLRWSWMFRAESWSGRSTLYVASNTASRQVIVQSTPRASKTTEISFDDMLERVLAYGASLGWGLTPGNKSAALDAGQSLHAVHPLIIEHYLGALESQLAHILLDPVLAGRPMRIEEALRANRPLTPGDLSWLALRPDRLRELRSGDPDVIAPRLVRRDAYDHPANRYVVTLLRRLRVALAATASALKAFTVKPLLGDLEKQRAADLAGRAERASGGMAAALRHPVLASLEPGGMTEGVALVFAGHPAYGRFSTIARRLLAPAARVEDDGDLEAGLKRSWDLFEIYTLFRLCEHLERILGIGWSFTRPKLVHHVLSAPQEGLAWTAVHSSGRRWELRYQERFRYDRTMGPNSISSHRVPDFVLLEFEGKRLVRWMMLDAKYRTAEPSINEALASMHVYRDCLLWNCLEGGELRASGGYLVVPSVASESRRFAEPEYRRRRRFGLLAIEDPSAFADLLGDI